MNEHAPKVVYEGTGKPDSKIVVGIKQKTARWAERTFTFHGREEVAREQLLKNFATVSKKLSHEERTAAFAKFSESLDKHARARAIGSIVRDTVVGGTVVLVGATAWKYRGILEFSYRSGVKQGMEVSKALRTVNTEGMSKPIRTHALRDAQEKAIETSRKKLKHIVEIAQDMLEEKGQLSASLTKTEHMERVARRASQILRRAHKLSRQ